MDLCNLEIEHHHQQDGLSQEDHEDAALLHEESVVMKQPILRTDIRSFFKEKSYISEKQNFVNSEMEDDEDDVYEALGIY